MWWAEFLLPVLKDVYGRAPTAFSSRSGVVDAGLLRGVCAAGKMPLQASGAKPPFAHGDPGFLYDFATGPCPLACTACASVLPPPPSLVMVVSPGGGGKALLTILLSSSSFSLLSPVAGFGERGYYAGVCRG